MTGADQILISSNWHHTIKPLLGEKHQIFTIYHVRDDLTNRFPRTFGKFPPLHAGGVFNLQTQGKKWLDMGNGGHVDRSQPYF